jgi:hypothetical protein
MVLTLLVLLPLQETAFSQDWWNIEYDGSLRPDAATPNWTLDGAGDDAVLPGGIYRLTDNSGSRFSWRRTGPGLLDSSFTYEVRLKMVSVSEPMHAVYARVGRAGLNLTIDTNKVHLQDNQVDFHVDFTTTDDFHLYRVVENQDSIYLYVDGVRRISKVNSTDAGNYFWWGSILDGGRSEAYWDYIRINSSARVFPSTLCQCPLQGDINGDTVIDVFDVIGVIGIAFSGDPDPQDTDCPRTRGDVDSNGDTDVFDVIYMIATSFSGGSNPVDPCL